MRALIIVVKENDLLCMNDLSVYLENLASKSRTAKLWVDCLNKPVLIVVSFTMAEREGNWILHLASLRLIIPYFYAAGHVHYARYILHYLLSMEKVPSDLQKRF